MSNALAAAAVTTTLSTRFTSLLNDLGISGLPVTIGHPKSDPDAGTYLHLARVSPNSALRNADLPFRSASGGAAGRPVLAIDLHYTLTFVGADDTIDAEHLVGVILADLHTRPILTPEEIVDAVAATPAGSAVRRSDLHRQGERVRVTLTPLNLEDHGRLWGLFNQSFHALTVSLTVGPVLIDGDRDAALGLPVSTLGAVTVGTRPPRVDAAVDATSGQPLVVPGATLVVRGASLAADTVRLRFGAVLTVLDPSAITATELRWTVAGADLVPGPAVVVVEHLMTMPADGSQRVLSTSAPVAVGLAPAIGATSTTGTGDTRTLTVAISPAATSDQPVELFLSGAGGNRSFRAVSVGAGGAVFPVGSLTGTWSMQLAVDGVVALPAVAGDGTWQLPTVTL